MEDEKDFIESDYCTECDGSGEVDGEQCMECERLHAIEIRADRLEDEWKGD